MDKGVIVIGGGGHGKVVIDTLLALGKTVIGFTDADTSRLQNNILGIRGLGNDDALGDHPADGVVLANGVGATANTSARRKIHERLCGMGYQFGPLVHPMAYVANSSVLGDGAQVMAGAVIQPGCLIGDNIIINTRASIDHDCVVGNHVHIAPGATVAGGVEVGDDAMIGAGATVLPSMRIGQGAVVGAGAVVSYNVADNTTVVGIPTQAVTAGIPSKNKKVT